MQLDYRLDFKFATCYKMRPPAVSGGVERVPIGSGLGYSLASARRITLHLKEKFLGEETHGKETHGKEDRGGKKTGSKEIPCQSR